MDASLLPATARRAISLSSPRLVTPSGYAGIGFFLLFNLVVIALVVRNPLQNSVVPVYRLGSLGWWQGNDIYGEGIHGFIYLPIFAVLYTPFALLGPRLGDSLWRICSDIVLLLAIWRMLSLALAGNPTRWRVLIFGAVLLLALPSSFGALRNGQATGMMLGLMLLGTVDIIGERWWRAAMLLALAFAVKPLAIVLMLLVAVLYPKISWRLAIAVAVLLVLPLINPDPARAWQLYGLGIAKVLDAGDPGIGRWADIAGFLEHLGLPAPDPVMTAVRLVAALLTLALAFATRRNANRTDAAFNILALSIAYLMLMNPRTEGNTYLALGVIIGLYVAILVHREDDQRAGFWLVLIALGFLVPTMLPPDPMILPQPLLGLAFTWFLVRRCLTRSAAPPAPAFESSEFETSG